MTLRRRRRRSDRPGAPSSPTPDVDHPTAWATATATPPPAAAVMVPADRGPAWAIRGAEERARSADVATQWALLGNASTGRAVLAVLPDHLDLFEADEGLAAGEALLAAIGERLASAVRGHDRLVPLDRRGWLVVAGDLPARRDLERLTTRLADNVRRPLTLGDRSIVATVRIGAAPDFERVHDVDRLAGVAIGLANGPAAGGGAGVAIGDASDHGPGASPWSALQAVHRAVDGDQLVTHHQPVVELASGSVRSVEALVRWQHPERGLLHPGAFLDLLRRARLDERLTGLVVTSAADHAAALAAVGAGVPVSINVARWWSPVDELIALVERAIGERGLDPGSLVIEIPEAVLLDVGIEGPTPSGALGGLDASTVVRRLTNAGIPVAVDAGSGDGDALGASVPAALLAWYKLDRSWLMPRLRPALPNLVADLRRRLPELELVGLGIGDDESRAAAVDAGLAFGQGFAVGRPLDTQRTVDAVAAGTAATLDQASGTS